MKNINYLKGDATAPQIEGNKIIVHICNDLGGWGKGFVLAISKKWSEPEKAYRLWYKNKADNDFALGATQVIQVSEDIFVGNMIAQQGLKRVNNIAPIRYEAVKSCLSKIAIEASKINASIHMPRIGCGLAGGKWEEIEPLILETLSNNDIEVYVYDFG
ncbi:macro domain-containing protein [Jejuia spongiicola]|uniref:Macro domain-containing protein n=1 Tax=Jejuia spongiicola TaxID=2942207 RepID=A0ABT0Q9V8_9FLAO|nr:MULTISPECIES: macro domain-containing protein [Flavobacteriaceae]MCL6293713.1 macro domain-containing protein [Jejuia spongiicola]PIA78733.1 Appr-1-p processing protein [Gaetbulibacter sp. 4G1]